MLHNATNSEFKQRCRIDFGTLYTENLKQETLGFWSILFKNVLQRQKHFQNVEKSKYAKKNSKLTLTFSISNVVFKVPNIVRQRAFTLVTYDHLFDVGVKALNPMADLFTPSQCENLLGWLNSARIL